MNNSPKRSLVLTDRPASQKAGIKTAKRASPAVAHAHPYTPRKLHTSTSYSHHHTIPTATPRFHLRRPPLPSRPIPTAKSRSLAFPTPSYVSPHDVSPSFSAGGRGGGGGGDEECCDDSASVSSSVTGFPAPSTVCSSVGERAFSQAGEGGMGSICGGGSGGGGGSSRGGRSGRGGAGAAVMALRDSLPIERQMACKVG